ncbi:MAG TPA: glycogen synthase, partial [Candidatus Omnitrophica bacterium]|nr:glycogen synthase [Candidatus Omnitrophota bacterium]
MKAVIFSSEVFPFAKTGGLADVTGALPLGLEEVGLEVKVFMPLYKNIKPQAINEEFGVSKIGKNIEVIFIRNDDYYLRDYLYNTPSGDYPDNLERFSFFCRKSLEVLKKIEFQPQILHCNDWQTALIPLYLEVLKNNEP